METKEKITQNKPKQEGRIRFLADILGLKQDGSQPLPDDPDLTTAEKEATERFRRRGVFQLDA